MKGVGTEKEIGKKTKKKTNIAKTFKKKKKSESSGHHRDLREKKRLASTRINWINDSRGELKMGM